VNTRHAIATYRGHRIPQFKLIEHRNWWFIFSGIFIALSLIGLFSRGLNLSIAFKGGAQIEYTYKTPVTVPQVTATLAGFGRGDAEVQIVNGNQVSIRTSALSSLGLNRPQQLLDALAKQAGITVADINQQDVGPTWGKEISRKALVGLIVVLLAITAYIALRFEWKMAAGAQIALLHDLIITGGIYALVGREVTPETVIAILTILGFSLYDTVVIYDKIQENTESTAMIARLGYTGVVDRSLNQVLMRSVNTSLVVLLPILSLLLFGGQTLKDFAFAMFVGVMTGAYSSIFIAAPLLTIFKEREPKYRQLQERAAQREARGKSPVAATVGVGAPAASAAAAARSTARTASPGRPRPKSKRKPPAKKKRR
jgi:preprotein translocase SecF subunit